MLTEYSSIGPQFSEDQEELSPAVDDNHKYLQNSRLELDQGISKKLRKVFFELNSFQTMSSGSLFYKPFVDVDAKNKIDKKMLKYFSKENKTNNLKSSRRSHQASPTYQSFLGKQQSIVLRLDDILSKEKAEGIR